LKLLVTNTKTLMELYADNVPLFNINFGPVFRGKRKLKFFDI